MAGGRRQPSLTKDLATIRKQLGRNRPVPTPKPTALRLDEIRQWPAVFQHRGPRGFAGEAHVRTLAAAIKRSSTQTLDPMTVWWDGRAWACVDGHHRLDAYKEAGVATDHEIPVRVFEGSLEDAMAEAARANTRDKLAMSPREKSNTAWRLTVATTQMSKADIATTAEVSEGTVASMRKVFRQLKAMEESAVEEIAASPVSGFEDLDWPQAKALAAGIGNKEDVDWEAAMEKEAQKMALDIRRAIGDRGAKRPQVLARALEVYDGRLVSRLIDEWRDFVQEPEPL